MNKRKYDLIVWGATGFTGKLVVEYLSEKEGLTDLKWAIAGRDEGKLKALRSTNHMEDLPVIIADSQDLNSLREMVKQCRLVITTVGPYAKWGSFLVEACIEQGTDYCDLCGEVHWMRKMIDKYQEKALESGVRLVNCCGFDSVPSDMGVFFMQKKALELTGGYFEQISMRLKAAKGGLSGGTVASMFNISQEAQKDRSIYKTIFNRYSLNPDPDFQGPDKSDLRKVVKDPITGGWISPFIMATINTRVVRRSHALNGFPFGENFTYDEAVYCGRGWKGKLKAWMYIIPLGFLTAAKPGTLLNKIIRKVLPKPGEGPDRKKIEKGYFKLDFYGSSSDGKVYKGTVKGNRDPGYGATVGMLVETALCLIDNPKPEMNGFLTPSTAGRNQLIEKLESNAGMEFSWIGEV